MLGVKRRELLCRRVDTDDVNAELRVKGKQRSVVAPDIENNITGFQRIAAHKVTDFVLEVPDHGTIQSGSVAVVIAVHLIEIVGLAQLHETACLVRASPVARDHFKRAMT